MILGNHTDMKTDKGEIPLEKMTEWELWREYEIRLEEGVVMYLLSGLLLAGSIVLAIRFWIVGGIYWILPTLTLLAGVAFFGMARAVSKEIKKIKELIKNETEGIGEKPDGA